MRTFKMTRLYLVESYKLQFSCINKYVTSFSHFNVDILKRKAWYGQSNRNFQIIKGEENKENHGVGIHYAFQRM